jgi:hypothetical protein
LGKDSATAVPIAALADLQKEGLAKNALSVVSQLLMTGYLGYPVIYIIQYI